MKRRAFLKKTAGLSLASTAPFLGAPAADGAGPGDAISLEGEWGVRLDPKREGGKQGWPEQSFSRTLRLPGSTDEAGLGERTTKADFGYLTRAWKYDGPCWYQKDVRIPAAWRGHDVHLFLERCHWESRVWVDGKALGDRNSLSTPHCYDLGTIEPGRHRITIRIDNSPIVNIGRYGHSYTEMTQSIWNGIVGKMELRPMKPVRIEALQLYPDVAGGRVRVAGSITNATGEAVRGRLKVAAREAGGRGQLVGEFTEPVECNGDRHDFRAEVSLSTSVRLWDEFHPWLYEAEVTLLSSRDRVLDQRRERFGMREVGTRDRRITLNGKPIFLRGTLECCIFPKTGYPPTDITSWRRLLAKARAYGLNHLRFHSWCPPEAAFVAADEAGFLLQVETPLWIDKWMGERTILTTEPQPPQRPEKFGADTDAVRFIRDELRRILEAYGNHPSFCLLCIGNEIYGDYNLLNEMIVDAKRQDPRRLYSCSTARRHTKGDDFHVTHATRGGPVRGIHGTGSSSDFLAAKRASDVPVISHEVGQWVTHPDYTEIEKYTGPLEPRNLDSFRVRLEKNGMLDQAGDFQRASGKFAWKVYKEEIEAISRTPLAGYQLLQLQDFPGQGEALVGLLDSFWDSKGILTPDQMRRFCGETVPLLRMEKFVWRAGETFTARAEVIHHGEAAIENAVAEWKISGDDGRVVASGQFPPVRIPAGCVTTLGRVKASLDRITEAAHLKMTIAIRGTHAANEWDFWVYPPTLPAPPSGVVIAREFDRRSREALAAGKSVLLLAVNAGENNRRSKTQFLPVYWSFAMFQKQPGCLGTLCDPNHPALAAFPTEFHCDWQWRELMEKGRAFVLNETPRRFRPIVQVIDDFHRANKLGAIFETRVGPGRLVACSLDLDTDLETRLVARQLRYSLLCYMASERFQPKAKLEPALLGKLLG